MLPCGSIPPSSIKAELKVAGMAITHCVFCSFYKCMSYPILGLGAASHIAMFLGLRVRAFV